MKICEEDGFEYENVGKMYFSYLIKHAIDFYVYKRNGEFD